MGMAGTGTDILDTSCLMANVPLYNKHSMHQPVNRDRSVLKYFHHFPNPEKKNRHA